MNKIRKIIPKEAIDKGTFDLQEQVVGQSDEVAQKQLNLRTWLSQVELRLGFRAYLGSGDLVSR